MGTDQLDYDQIFAKLLEGIEIDSAITCGGCCFFKNSIWSFIKSYNSKERGKVVTIKVLSERMKEFSESPYGECIITKTIIRSTNPKCLAFQPSTKDLKLKTKTSIGYLTSKLFMENFLSWRFFYNWEWDTRVDARREKEIEEKIKKMKQKYKRLKEKHNWR